MSFGLMGGAMQAQGHVQFLLNMLVFGMDVQQAMDAARFRQSTECACAGGADYRQRSHGAYRAGSRIIAMHGQQFGGSQAIIKLPRGYMAGSDPRKDGYAAGSDQRVAPNDATCPYAPRPSPSTHEPTSSVEADERLHALAAQRWRIAITLTAVMIVIVLRLHRAHRVRPAGARTLVAPGLTVGILLGALVIVVSWLLTTGYVRWANTRYDVALRELQKRRRDAGAIR